MFGHKMVVWINIFYIKQLTQLATNNYKRIFTNKIVCIGKYIIYLPIFVHATFLSLTKVSFVFNVSSSHSTTNLLIRHFAQEQFLISKYSPILHA